MGARNFLVEGVSGTGKTSVCDELLRRGYQAIHGDRVLAYQGDPRTGEPTAGFTHDHHLWRVPLFESLVADHAYEMTFFCGGCRNLSQILDSFDGVFVLEADLQTVMTRLRARPEDEWGGKQSERDLVRRLHRTKEDQPVGAVVIDATQPLTSVVDEILRRTGFLEPLP